MVTGASSGIGRAIAEVLGANGAHVVLGGRTETALAASVERIRASGGSAEARSGDIRRVEEVQALVDRAVESTGRLDIMVNNAGISYPEPILDADPEHWRTMLETNVLALLVGCQAAVRAMRACGAEGVIVNISSVAALAQGGTVYGATKHAVNSISETLRCELFDDRISVVTVMPGAVATSFARNYDPAIIGAMAQSAGMDSGIVGLAPGERLPDELLAKAQEAMSELLCTPEQIAEAVLWAATRERGAHVTELVVRPKRDLHV